MVIGECAAVPFGQDFGRRFVLNADAEILRDGPNLIGKVIENLRNNFPYGTFGFFNGHESPHVRRRLGSSSQLIGVNFDPMAKYTLREAIANSIPSGITSGLSVAVERGPWRAYTKTQGVRILQNSPLQDRAEVFGNPRPPNAARGARPRSAIAGRLAPKGG